MSTYDESRFLIHLLKALEDTLKETVGEEGLVTIALQVARHVRKMLEHEFENAGSIEIKDCGEFVKRISENIASKLGLNLTVDIKKEGEGYKLITKLKEMTAAVLIPITIVAIALEEARQRGNKKFVISDAKISGDVFELHLMPV